MECPKEKLQRILPLIAVVQPHKASTPVRPVLDFRELNEYVRSDQDADTASVTETLRRWRRLSEATFIDLKKAYLKIFVKEGLSYYQGVKYKGRFYRLTRLGFGFVNAPKMLRAVVRYCLKDEQAADDFFDDLAISTADSLGGEGPGDMALMEATDRVVEVMRKNGFESKPPEALKGATVLGLKVDSLEAVVAGGGAAVQPSTGPNELVWSRRMSMQELADTYPPDQYAKMTWRQMSGFVGALTSHVPVAGWLRCVTAVLKRLIGQNTGPGKQRWNLHVSHQCACLAQAIWGLLKTRGDPAVGVWRLPPADEPVVVYTDASGLAEGVVVADKQDRVLEDAVWLRKLRKSASEKPAASLHINVAELDALLKGVDRVIALGLKRATFKCDNKSVVTWVGCALRHEKINVQGMYRLLVLRRLEILQAIVADHGLMISIEWVPTHANVADELTRVPREIDCIDGWESTLSAIADEGSEGHEDHHQHEGDDDLVAALMGMAAGGVAASEDEKLVQKMHAELLHPGVAATKAAVEAVLGRKCDANVMSAVVGKCPFCEYEHLKVPPRIIAKEGFRQALADRPWRVIATDVTHVNWSGVSFDVLTAMCEYSRFLVARIVPSESASDLWAGLKSIFDMYGYPEFVRSDRGKGYVTLQSTFAKYGIRGLLCTAERPTANGCVERVHRSLKDRLRALEFIGQGVGVRKALDIAVRAYNFIPHSALDMRSPISVFHGRAVRLGFEQAAEEPVCEVPDVFSVGDQVWLRRPEGQRGRGESTFLPDRYVVLACRGRSVTLKPLLSNDKRKIVTVASDRVAMCKSSLADVALGDDVDSVYESEGVDLLDLARDDIDQEVVRGQDDRYGNVVDNNVAREARDRRPPARFGIDEFVYT